MIYIDTVTPVNNAHATIAPRGSRAEIPAPRVPAPSHPDRAGAKRLRWNLPRTIDATGRALLKQIEKERRVRR